MGKLEKIGRNIWKKIGGKKRKEPRSRTPQLVMTSSDDDDTTAAVDVDVELEDVDSHHHLSNTAETSSMPHNQVAEQLHRSSESRQSKHSDDVSGYATDDTVLSSLPQLDTSRDGLDDKAESLGYHSTSELSPRGPSFTTEDLTHPQLYSTYQPTRYRRGPFQSTSELASSPRPLQKIRFMPTVQRSQDGLDDIKKPSMYERAVTIDQIDRVKDPIDHFLRNNIYKTKLVTTVFEAKNGGLEDLYSDVVDEVDRWFATKNMMAVACELHFSVPEEKRNRMLECRLKEKLLSALRDNNKRLLYMKGMGHGKMPIKLAESKTEENISKDVTTNSIRGVYQRSYTRLLPYLHKETPEWHAPYWKLEVPGREDPPPPKPERFLWGDSPASLKSTTLVSLNIIGLSILGNKRRSCDQLFQFSSAQ